MSVFASICDTTFVALKAVEASEKANTKMA